MNAKEYRLRWVGTREELSREQERSAAWRRRAVEVECRQLELAEEVARLEAKLSAAREFVAEANEEFTKAAAEDAAMVEQFNG